MSTPCSASHNFIRQIPKVELHVHLEGCLSPELRLEIARKNGIPQSPDTVEEMRAQYLNAFNGMFSGTVSLEQGGQAFFDHLYDGIKVLRTSDDFYQLAMSYYQHASETNIRYAEIFTEFQDLMDYVPLEVAMSGYRKAQLEAEQTLNVTSRFIFSFARTKSPAELMAAYEAALLHRDMIVGFGLAGFSDESSTMKFNDVFTRAKRDGFRITAHCEAETPERHEFLREYMTKLGGTGLDRIDHGMSVAYHPDLMELAKARDIGVTVCPWVMWVFFQLQDGGGPEAADHKICNTILRTLVGAGVNVSVGSDDPALTGDRWLEEGLQILADRAVFTKEEILGLQLSSARASWASTELKSKLADEIRGFGAAWQDSAEA